MATILAICQQVANELAVPEPSSLIGSTNKNDIRLLAHANQTIREMRDRHKWPELTREHTFTTTASTASYALPADFDRHVFGTHWDRAQSWELIGPVDPMYWQWRQSGISTAVPRREFRVKGISDTQLFIYPTPDTSNETLVFEYQSLHCVRPKTWVTSTAFAAATYSFYNGNFYFTTAGGTTGATPPTHTSGSASDGTVTWIYTNSQMNSSGVAIEDYFDEFLNDADVPLLDRTTLELGIKWRFMEQLGFQFETYYEKYERSLKRARYKTEGAPVLSYLPSRRSLLISLDNVPDGQIGL